MSTTTPRIPRHRAPVIPVGSRLRWIELPALARIGIGVAIGLIALAALGAVS